jgi:hypothetical protein
MEVTTIVGGLGMPRTAPIGAAVPARPPTPALHAKTMLEGLQWAIDYC